MSMECNQSLLIKGKSFQGDALNDFPTYAKVVFYDCALALSRQNGDGSSSKYTLEKIVTLSEEKEKEKEDRVLWLMPYYRKLRENDRPLQTTAPDADADADADADVDAYTP
ncbi:hypothetical protein HZH66_001510 [Vespula vulgaris]|uniref:Uncharacterized protein n=1 Tax=Vespula vulgaris TaxID=7454 RepID=A0A834KR91_VESVU|nr:hypothetical protein HZH66_001510 [Vespula vulgaris]